MPSDQILIGEGLIRVALLMTIPFLNKKADLTTGPAPLLFWVFAWGFTVLSLMHGMMKRGSYDITKTVAVFVLFASAIVLAYSIYLTVMKSKKDKKEDRTAEQKKMSTTMVALSWTVFALSLISYKFLHKYEL